MRTKSKINPIHPGEILSEEFMKPLGLTQYRVAHDLHISQTRLSEIIKGKRLITADTAIRLSNYFGNSALFWMNLQDEYNLQKELHGKNEKIYKTVKRCTAVA